MQSWPQPSIPTTISFSTQLELFDTADQVIKPVALPDNPQQPVGIYVCGITPYDSTHLGHAATYVTFDLIQRQLIALGHKVHFVQNITDVDDPLFERAQRDGVDWRELGTDQINLFRGDMQALSILPPQHYIGAMESIDEVVSMVSALLANGSAYIVDDPTYPDIYASVSATKHFGYESNYDRATMAKFFAERGGDPQRLGKRDPLDALIWRAHREGEPRWEAPFGAGRPGWHIECSAIATNRLGHSFAIQGGGSDLIFPHHEFSAAHAEAIYGVHRMANHYVHTGMIALDGVKMSKSLGNLVFVSQLISDGTDPSAIRLGIYAGHYRNDRDWSNEVLTTAHTRLSHWREALARCSDLEASTACINQVQQLLAHNLDTPAALSTIDSWAQNILAQGSTDTNPQAQELLRNGLDLLLGVKL
ncbi:cysteine--1-D-myo-inosityl 2-amino-2-deoxy-alpha-D-glucopyranoside ligase [Corynebacterium kutscheri]|uniref:L-cysteine:1D-myo-inositol 2-amino-2-deoxy-alpha-D-glucopyranoside ligase n=1 Tax=Corynebacterium kutscheri TaxID=35755 RepID=A0AB38VU80_9CORY|nr:cysteine--1-D-myo-inosityl 2-amino-2-deoxy-alpha-D-glucopyranoside ligase [Corynebacterium kutscheri]VEH08504.1 cysteinyl-tRNA synthetase [Corynebacterium kutscheri]